MVSLKILYLCSLPATVVAAVSMAASCDTDFNSGFGLGALSLPPANNISTAPPTGQHKIGIRFEKHCLDGRGLTLNYWYPATEQDVAGTNPYVSTGGIVGQAVQDAPVDSSNGPFPLIVFSPGLAAVDDAYYFYLQNLASRGYVVVSIQHWDSRTAKFTQNIFWLALAQLYALFGATIEAVVEQYTEWFRETEFAMTYRPQEIKFALDHTLKTAQDPSAFLHGVLDTDNIGLSGHSLGGFYTNLIGGGMPLYCDYPKSPVETNPNAYILARVTPCAFPSRQNMDSPSALHDPRIKAIIPLAAPTFIARSQLARSAMPIKIPMLTLTGDSRTAETTAWVQRSIHDHASGPSYWVMVNGTNHYLVADAYGLNPTLASKTGLVQDMGVFAAKAAVYMTYSAAFFDLYLKGDEAARDILHTASSESVVELDYRND